METRELRMTAKIGALKGNRSAGRLSGLSLKTQSVGKIVRLCIKPQFAIQMDIDRNFKENIDRTSRCIY